ncbi:MAG: adenylosuccinate lyase [Roseovarius sp.]
MKLKFGLAALALAAMPSFAIAAGCSYGKDRQAMTCAEGSTWDSETSTCQPVASS